MGPPSSIWLVLGAVACNGGETDSSGEDDDTFNDDDTGEETSVVVGEPPTISLEVPPSPIAEHGIIRGSASDPDQGSDSLIVELRSSIDGSLLQVSPSPDTTWQWEGNLSVGRHQIIATVWDADDNDVSATATLDVVRINRAPECEIVAPVNGAVYESGTTVQFEGTATDYDEDALRLYWTSSISGALFLGTTYSRVLPNGSHTITLAVDDLNGGTCTRSVDIVVGGDAG